MQSIEDRVDDETSLLEILVVLTRHARLVFLMPFIAGVLAAAVSLLLPNIYTATARLLPPQQSGSPLTAVLMGDTSSLNPGSAVGQALGLRNPSDLYVGMLQSNSIADSMIKRFDLRTLYDKDTLIETRKRLADMSSILSGQDGIITIEVSDEDPKRAANMANAYVEELDRLSQTVATTTAGRQRVFLEKQLRQAKDQLAEAEVSMRVMQEKTGLISVPDQGKAMIESVATLRALVAAKQVQLAAMRAGTTERNPDYVRAQHELSGLRSELAKLEKSNQTDPSTVIPSAGKIAESGLEYLRRMRDVQYFQTLFELLAKQYEIAKAQEAAEAGVIQILDRASPPDRKARPTRILIVLVTMVIAFLAAVVGAFSLESRLRAKSDPQQAVLLEEFEAKIRSWLPARFRPKG